MQYKAEFIVKSSYTSAVFNLHYGESGNRIHTGGFPVVHLNIEWIKKFWPHLTKELTVGQSRRMRVILSTTELRQSIPITLISRECNIQIECGDEGTGPANHIFGKPDSAEYPYFCKIVFSRIFRKISKILKYGNNPMWLAVRRA